MGGSFAALSLWIRKKSDVLLSNMVYHPFGDYVRQKRPSHWSPLMKKTDDTFSESLRVPLGPSKDGAIWTCIQRALKTIFSKTAGE